jgi:hypothetical protein
MDTVRALMSQRVARFLRKSKVITPASIRLAVSRASLCGIIPLTLTA